jgi:hypothetical protein
MPGAGVVHHIIRVGLERLPHVRLGGNLGNANARGAAAVQIKFDLDETELKLPRLLTGACILICIAAIPARTPM